MSTLSLYTVWEKRGKQKSWEGRWLRNSKNISNGGFFEEGKWCICVKIYRSKAQKSRNRIDCFKADDIQKLILRGKIENLLSLERIKNFEDLGSMSG